MSHFCTVSFIQVLQMLFILMCFITFSSGTVSVSLEDTFTKLEIKVYQLEEKNVRLEEKVTELEARNAQLEIKVKEQETIVISLLSQTDQSKSSLNPFLDKSTGKSGNPKTCQELRASDPSLPSGMYFIDPDGQDYGYQPIYVYCNMTTGSTSILHDSESPMNVSRCADPGCYFKSIYYRDAPLKQIETLIDLSAECHQSIKYDCYYAPFELNNIPYAWWNDRKGNVQYFWAGNNTDGIHTCQCGIDGNCADSSFKCNCDVTAPIQLVDEGVITDKNLLPVLLLNFGGTQMQTSIGVHTLGRFECSGSSALTGLPKSCEDLKMIGHTLNGFYSVMGSAMMESVYCDFTKLSGDAEFQKWIGYADVKSAPVHFYVQQNSSFNTAYTPIPFNSAVVNKGNAMNLTSGIFTAPRPGTYFFSFTGMAKFPASTSSAAFFGIFLCWDRFNFVGRAGISEEANTNTNKFSPLTLQTTLYVKKGDQVWLGIDGMSSGASLFDDVGHFTHFTGFLLEEEINVA